MKNFWKLYITIFFNQALFNHRISKLDVVCIKLSFKWITVILSASWRLRKWASIWDWTSCMWFCVIVVVKFPVALSLSLFTNCWITKAIESPSFDCTRYLLLLVPEMIVTTLPVCTCCKPSAFQFCLCTSPVSSMNDYCKLKAFFAS